MRIGLFLESSSDEQGGGFQQGLSTIEALTNRLAQILRPATDTRNVDPAEPVADTLSKRELLERIALEFDALGARGVNPSLR